MTHLTNRFEKKGKFSNSQECHVVAGSSGQNLISAWLAASFCRSLRGTYLSSIGMRGGPEPSTGASSIGASKQPDPDWKSTNYSLCFSVLWHACIPSCSNLDKANGGSEVYDVVVPYKQVRQISFPNLLLLVVVFYCVSGHTWLRCMVKARSKDQYSTHCPPLDVIYSGVINNEYRCTFTFKCFII